MSLMVLFLMIMDHLLYRHLFCYIDVTSPMVCAPEIGLNIKIVSLVEVCFILTFSL